MTRLFKAIIILFICLLAVNTVPADTSISGLSNRKLAVDEYDKNEEQLYRDDMAKKIQNIEKRLSALEAQ